MADVVITEFMDESAIATLRSRYPTTYDPDLWQDPQRLRSELSDARAIVVRNKTTVDAELLETAPSLEVVGRLGVGLDNIDLEACATAGVTVKPASGANAAAVAEYVIGMAWVLVRGITTANARMIAGEWPRTYLVGGELGARVLGLIGVGTIALEVAGRAGALGMEVVGFDPLIPEDAAAWNQATRCATLEELLATANIISIHVPLSPRTKGLIGPAELNAMRHDAIVINTSRGEIVDEVAIAEALRTGNIGGAALDVFATEPLDASSAAVFEDADNLILTPHIAGITAESNLAVSAVTAQNVIAVLG